MIPERSREISADWLNEVPHSSGFLKDANITALQHELWGVLWGSVSDMARLTVANNSEVPHLPSYWFGGRR